LGWGGFWGGVGWLVGGGGGGKKFSNGGEGFVRKGLNRSLIAQKKQR